MWNSFTITIKYLLYAIFVVLVHNEHYGKILIIGTHRYKQTQTILFIRSRLIRVYTAFSSAYCIEKPNCSFFRTVMVTTLIV